MRFRALLLALLVAVASLPARAQTVADIETVWRTWMTKHGRADGIAVPHGDRVVHQATMACEAAAVTRWP
ncbi:MAG: hypothetical protein Q8L22_21930 [Reyranella sp.]|nr:hypothetical protein [Reyranella sp.]